MAQSVAVSSDAPDSETEILTPLPSSPANINSPALKPVYRFFSATNVSGGGYYLTDDRHDSRAASMEFKGFAFNVLADNLPGSTPLYTCQVLGADYVVSPDGCDPHKFITIRHIGYVLIEQAANTIPVSFCWNLESGWHNATINPDKDCPPPAVVEFILGYVPE